MHEKRILVYNSMTSGLSFDNQKNMGTPELTLTVFVNFIAGVHDTISDLLLSLLTEQLRNGVKKNPYQYFIK